MSNDWTSKPYASWLEETIRELVKANPVSIAMEIVDETGMVFTCYYNASPNDRACMIDAMRDDARWEWLTNNREEIMAILSEEGDGEEDDDEQGTATETGCEDG